MAAPSSVVVENSVVVAAPAAVVFDLLVDVSAWPQLFTSIIHAERDVTDTGDVVQAWQLRDGERVIGTRSHRAVDPDRHRISWNDERVDGSTVTTGQWEVTAADADAVTVTVRRELAADAVQDASWYEGADAALLAELKSALDRHEELDQLMISFEDPLFIDGDVAEVYDVLYRADLWPSKFPHVKRIDMTEDVPNVQFFDMDTVTPDGRAHTTRSVRLCFPTGKIVYKQISLPPLLTAHIGHWLFTETPEGLIASARHAATIKPSALPMLGEGTTVADARRYLRRVLSANSTSNLRIAKTQVERDIAA